MFPPSKPVSPSGAGVGTMECTLPVFSITVTSWGVTLRLQVREALQDTPERVEDFVSLLHEFEHVGEGQEVTSLFRKLRSILGERTELLRDFAAFLHPEQALQCGLVRTEQVLGLGCAHVVLLTSPQLVPGQSDRSVLCLCVN